MQRVSMTCDHDVVIGEEKLFLDVGGPIRPPQHAVQQVKLSGAQLIQQIFVMTIDDSYPGRWISRQKFLDRIGQDLGGRVRDIADCDPRDDIASCGLELIQAVFYLAQRDLNSSGQFESVWGRRDASWGAPVEAPPQFPLQLAGRAVERGLRNP